MRPSLRRRLAVCLVGMAVGSLVLAVLVTAGLARSTARADAKRDLRDAAEGLARLAGAEQLANLSRRLSRVLDVDDVRVVFVRSDGALANIAGRKRDLLPARIANLDLDGPALAAGQTQVGSEGRTVFAAHPLNPTPAAARRAGLAGVDVRPVVVLTRRVAVFPLGRSGAFLLVAAGLAAGAAAAVAWWLSRRLTRPLAAMRRAAGAIAAGDLGARVEGAAGADDELATLAEAIDSMAVELERARRLERDFLMSVSHDLRTPLTSIRGYAEAIADGAADDDESRRKAAGIIGTEARRLERLVADLLDLARLDAREFSLHPRPVDLAAVVAATVDGLQPAAADAGVRLACRGPGGPLPAVIDPDRLGQVVANLVENALKYAATTVEVGVEPLDGDQARISVVDDGPGIAPEDLPHVFERLYTSRRPGSRGPAASSARKVGTGLGLAIVRELAGAMGGSVEVSATPEGGTRFVVSVVGSAVSSTTSTSAGPSSWSSSSSSSRSSTEAP